MNRTSTTLYCFPWWRARYNALALVLWYAAGASLFEGLVTLGVLIAFMEYIQRLFVPVRELSQQLAILQRAMAALDHIGELFVEPVDEA